jgi:hypothetical protein
MQEHHLTLRVRFHEDRLAALPPITQSTGRAGAVGGETDAGEASKSTGMHDASDSSGREREWLARGTAP